MSVTMLADAVRSEAYRLTRDRAQVFWSVFLVPLAFAIGGIGVHIFSKAAGDAAAVHVGLNGLQSAQPVNLAEALAFGANFAANGALLILALVGAATVYAGDYRWETWRLISARNSRPLLILGKVGVVKMMALGATLAFILAAIVFYVAQAIVYQRPVTFSMSGVEASHTLLIWLLSYVRVVQFGLLALLTAVVSRSLMASLFVPWALGFGQGILGSLPVMMMLGLKPDGWPAQLLLPGLAYDTLKAAVIPGLARLPMDSSPVAAAVTGLALWTLVPLVVAILLFQRQDLSKE